MLLKIKLLFTTLLLLVLYSCSSNTNVKLDKVTSCNFPQTSEKAPLWVCGASVDGLEVQGVGVAKKSKAGLNLTRQKAAANARVNIAQELKANIISEVSEKISSQSDGQTEIIADVSSFVSKQVVSSNLIGAKVYREVYSSDGTLYTLVGLNKDAYNKTIKNIEEQAQQDKNLTEDAKKTFGDLLY